MLTGQQIRAAAAALGWSLNDVADHSGVSWRTVQRMASANGVPPASAKNLHAVQLALEGAGVEFLFDGGAVGIRVRAG